jgi:hypothetical protein
MTEILSPGQKAVRTVAATYRVTGTTGRILVDAVVRELAEPDREMQEAGAAELLQALPPGTTPSYRRELAGVVWRAMLARAGCMAFALALAGPVLASDYQPRTLTLEFADGRTEQVAATSPRICEEALRALRIGYWRIVGEQPVKWYCGPGDRFAACDQYIVGFNAPPSCAGRQ